MRRSEGGGGEPQTVLSESVLGVLSGVDVTVDAADHLVGSRIWRVLSNQDLMALNVFKTCDTLVRQSSWRV